MPKVERFDDLKCWQETRALTRDISRLVENDALSRDFCLRDQHIAAAVSVMTNITEGFARYHRAEFIRFLDDVQSSAAEVKSLLYVVLDQQYAAAETVVKLQEQSETCQQMTLGLLKHVRRTMDGDGQAANEPAITYNSHSSGWDLSASLVAKPEPSPG